MHLLARRASKQNEVQLMIQHAIMTEPEDAQHDEGSFRREQHDRPLIIRSAELLQGRRELWIEHGDEMYRLRLTRSGKLYLTK
jgi:hemin uptake protein HemP